jgi:hypothetical protein
MSYLLYNIMMMVEVKEVPARSAQEWRALYEQPELHKYALPEELRRRYTRAPYERGYRWFESLNVVDLVAVRHVLQQCAKGAA